MSDSPAHGTAGGLVNNLPDFLRHVHPDLAAPGQVPADHAVTVLVTSPPTAGARIRSTWPWSAHRAIGRAGEHGAIVVRDADARDVRRRTEHVIRYLLLRLTCNLSAPDIRRDEPCLPHRLVIMIRISANIEYVATPPPMEKRADAPAKHSLLVVYGMLLPSSQSNANCVHGMTLYDRWRRQQWTVTPSPIAHLPPKHRYSVGCPIYRH